MKVIKVFLMVLVLALVGVGSYLIGAAKHDQEVARALIFLGGGKDVRMFNVLSQVGLEIEAEEIARALEIIAKQKAQIRSALEACYGQSTCEDEFSGVYPETWLADLHPNRRLQVD